MGWDGMGWDGMGWDGMGWDGMGWDGMGYLFKVRHHGVKERRSMHSANHLDYNVCVCVEPRQFSMLSVNKFSAEAAVAVW
jgi:hypothetical protein